MSKTAGYREQLRVLADWDSFLQAESGLPGPRSNLELLQAAVDEGDESRFRRWLILMDAPANTPQEFLLLIGVVGLGKLRVSGDASVLETLRRLASDSRWRVREAVCMALQRWGDTDMDALLAEMQIWSQGNPLEKRAAAAALCEPRLLTIPSQAEAVLTILDSITVWLAGEPDRRNENFKTLRKGLAYCWSVAVVALPETGKPLMEKWLTSADKDIAWIMKENLKKDRLRRMDTAWVERWSKHG